MTAVCVSVCVCVCVYVILYIISLVRVILLEQKNVCTDTFYMIPWILFHQMNDIKILSYYALYSL